MQIYMQCDHGEIEVFLCPEEESLGMGGAEVGNGAVSSAEEATDTESEASPVKAHPARPGLPPPSPPPRLEIDEESRSSDLGQIRNALISASEDFGPMGKTLQLQTLDQEQREYKSISRIISREYVLDKVNRQWKKKKKLGFALQYCRCDSSLQCGITVAVP